MLSPLLLRNVLYAIINHSDIINKTEVLDCCMADTNLVATLQDKINFEDDIGAFASHGSKAALQSVYRCCQRNGVVINERVPYPID